MSPDHRWRWGIPHLTFGWVGCTADAARVKQLKSVSLIVAALCVGWLSPSAAASSTDPAYWAWGLNDRGQLGLGNTTSPVTSPETYTGDIEFTTLTAGGLHACGLTAIGEAYCWGSNFLGQLGNGTTADASVPTLVSGSHSFTAIAAGGYFTCAIDGSRNTYCWGANTTGQLGNGSTTASTTPTLQNASPQEFVAITAGEEHACGITSWGSAYCWGYNNVGQLGLGNRATFSVTTPTAVTGGITFSNISAGRDHTCGVSASGASYCWGQNGDGELGIGGTSAFSDSPVSVSGALTFSSIHSGDDFTCALTSVNTAYCWGLNTAGQVGDGTTTSPRTSPTAVVGSHTFARVSVGKDFACGLTSSGAASCWGDNNDGQLGIGAASGGQTSPQLVSGGFAFSAVVLGSVSTSTYALPRRPTFTPSNGATVYSLELSPGAGARCSSSDLSSEVGLWVTLPSSSSCSPSADNADAVLLGWATRSDFPVDIAQRQVDNGWGAYETFNDDGRLTGVFIPAGGATVISAPGRLHAIWSSLVSS